MRNLALLFVALFLLVVLLPVALLFSAYRAIYLFEVPSRWARELAIAIDRLGNIAAKDLFNLILIKSSATHKFGDSRETISSVLGKNKLDLNLTIAGSGLAWVLDSIDPNHVVKSIQFFKEK